MCELDQLSAMPSASSAVNRRQFAALAGAGGLAACAPMGGAASTSMGLTETAVSFPAPGGTFDGVFIHPASGAHPRSACPDYTTKMLILAFRHRIVR